MGLIFTKKLYDEYRRCQNLGYFNMLDYESWKPYTTLTRDEWMFIIQNYDYLRRSYEKDI